MREVHESREGNQRQISCQTSPYSTKLTLILYSWISYQWELGLTLAFGMSMSDFISESRFGILTKNYTYDFHWICGKTRIEFSIFFVSTLWCNISSSVFDISHQPWWPRCHFSESRSPMVANEGVLESPGPPRHVRPSRSCRDVVNMLREAMFRRTLHGVAP